MLGYWQWFAPREMAPGIFRLDDGGYVNSYLVVGDREAVLVDTGLGIADVRRTVRAITALPVTVINTHAHWDHVMGNHLFSQVMIAKTEARWLSGPYPQDRLRRLLRSRPFSRPLPPGFSPRSYRFMPSRPAILLEGETTLDLGGRVLRVVPAPGHTPGSIAVLDEVTKTALVGDAAGAGLLYAQSPGGSDLAAWVDTLRRIASFRPECVMPGHGEPVAGDFLAAQAAEIDALIRGERRVWRRPDGLWQAELTGFSLLLPADYQAT